MSTAAILPLKGFDDSAKTRLAGELALGPRRALVEAMFIDVIIALRRTPSIERVIVVSTDHTVQQIAGGHGAAVVEDAVSGHSDAAARGIADAVEQGADRVLLVPGDCPLLDPTELEELLALEVSAPAAIVIPDHEGS
ncbi:MAG TPA: NTP transferase domain-containing protein, partial [Solirubrobacteraceae bacterium]|nr:NTP transferase domain-containing protein [Solirubrobacteraceae bacterium]